MKKKKKDGRRSWLAQSECRNLLVAAHEDPSPTHSPCNTAVIVSGPTIERVPERHVFVTLDQDGYPLMIPYDKTRFAKHRSHTT